MSRKLRQQKLGGSKGHKVERQDRKKLIHHGRFSEVVMMTNSWSRKNRCPHLGLMTNPGFWSLRLDPTWPFLNPSALWGQLCGDSCLSLTSLSLLKDHISLSQRTSSPKRGYDASQGIKDFYIHPQKSPFHQLCWLHRPSTVVGTSQPTD